VLFRHQRQGQRAGGAQRVDQRAFDVFAVGLVAEGVLDQAVDGGDIGVGFGA